MTRALLAALAAVAIGTAHAAPEPADVGPDASCITIANELKLIRNLGIGIQMRVYRGDDAQRMLMVLEELGAPEPENWASKVTAFLLMIGGENADPPALLKFFNETGCAFYALGTDHAGAARLQEKMGERL